jgi:hypothetical protein
VDQLNHSDTLNPIIPSVPAHPACGAAALLWSFRRIPERQRLKEAQQLWAACDFNTPRWFVSAHSHLNFFHIIHIPHLLSC